MAKKKRGEERNETSVQVAIGELMGLEEERQIAEREAAAARRADEERRRQEVEARRRAEIEARAREEQRAREEEERERRRLEAEREIRIRAEAEARARAEEMRRIYEIELQVKSGEQARRRLPVWVTSIAAALGAGGAVVLGVLYLAAQANATSRFSEAERAAATARRDLEREIDAERAARLDAVTELGREKQRFADEQRRLREACDGIPSIGASRPKGPRGSGPRQPAVQRPAGSALDGITELPPYVPDESQDGTIHLSAEDRKRLKEKAKEDGDDLP